MMAVTKKVRFGWYGDGGLGERMIELILSGRKTATTCPSYDPGEVPVQPGDRLELADKHGRTRGVIEVLRIELRPWGTFDEALAQAAGGSLQELREYVRLGNAREVQPDEEMRVVYFRLVERKS